MCLVLCLFRKIIVIDLFLGLQTSGKRTDNQHMGLWEFKSVCIVRETTHQLKKHFTEGGKLSAIFLTEVWCLEYTKNLKH